MTTRNYWAQVAERAAKTFAQTMVAALTAGATASTLDLAHVDWRTALVTAAGAMVLSVFTSLASARVGDGSPSLVSR